MAGLELSAEQIKRAFSSSRMDQLIEKFAQIGKDELGGVTRLAFSKEDLEARNVFIDIVQTELGLKARMDPLGNLFFRRPGRNPNAPAVMTGSHLDSVKNGGKYDGPAGVICALETFRALDSLDITTDHPFELVVFTSEEPNPFGISTFGSRGIAGKLDRRELAALKDEQGRTLPEALIFLGGDLDRLEEARIPPGSIAYFVELHIEQMPHLEKQQKDIGIVTGITGIHRKHIRVTGEASHCGTTTMMKRRDALCAAAELILALETAARKEQSKAVATIGHLRLFPNSINITPGVVEMDAEIRSFYPESIDRIVEALETAARSVRIERSILVELEDLYTTEPIHFSSTVCEAIAEAARFFGHSTLEEISMAGHDAAHLADLTDSGMIFVPCRGGVSHCPEEYTKTEDLVKGALTLFKTLLILDRK